MIDENLDNWHWQHSWCFWRKMLKRYNQKCKWKFNFNDELHCEKRSVTSKGNDDYNNFLQGKEHLLCQYLNSWDLTFKKRIDCNKLTTCTPWQIGNRYKWCNKIIQGPGHNHAVVDVVVSHHDHCCNTHTWKSNYVHLITLDYMEVHCINYFTLFERYM